MLNNPFLFGVQPPPDGATRLDRLRFVRALADRSAAASVLFFAVVGALLASMGFVAAGVAAAIGLVNHLSLTRKIAQLNR